MSKSIILLIFSLGAFISQSQSIQEWQKKHPDVLLIKEADATEDYIKTLDKKDIKYIIYSGELKIEAIDIAEISNEKSSVYSINNLNGDAIKKWLAVHKDVKILPRSYFDSLPENKKDVYLTNGALILTGEELTYEDIQRYNNQFENTLTH